MKLRDVLYDYTNDDLRDLLEQADADKTGRKDVIVARLVELLTDPASVRAIWEKMDDLSHKALSKAVHADGIFDRTAFAAQYGRLPERPQTGSRFWTRYGRIPLDLFIHNGRIPEDVLPVLAPLVPEPEAFRISTLDERPSVFHTRYTEHELTLTETEETGLSDLFTYLQMVQEGAISFTSKGRRITAGSARKLLGRLADGDFLPHDDKPRAADTIRPYGLDVFTEDAGLVSTKGHLTERGHTLLKTRDPDVLLEAFETWVHEGPGEELERISNLYGQTSSDTRLTPPSKRRSAVVEALSWCPANEWISVDEFLRALRAWQFDMETEATDYSHLSAGPKIYHQGWSSGDYFRIVVGLYVQCVLWEYLGTVGALDLAYTPSEDVYLEFDNYFADEPMSRYDGLYAFRINDLGAFLFGQSAEYEALARPPASFQLGDDGTLTLLGDAPPTHVRMMLDRIAAPEHETTYRLDDARLLEAYEDGYAWDDLADFLRDHHDGPLPEPVNARLERLRRNSQAFGRRGMALIIKVEDADLKERVLSDEVLGRFTRDWSRSMIALPASNESQFQSRLKELGYVLR